MKIHLIVTAHDVGDFVGVFVAEFARGPLAEKHRLSVRAPALDIPGETKKKLGADLGGLEITDVDDPDPIRALRVGLGHFLPDQGGRGGAEPEIRKRTAEIGNMVIDPEAPGAFSLGRRGEVADVAEIVVGPDDRDVVRHAQSLPVEIEDFLVGTEHLGHALDLGFHALGEHCALVGKDFSQNVDAFKIAFRALDGAVMDAAHAQRIDVFITTVGAHAFLPIGAHAFAVGDVVVVGLGRSPFADIVAEHGFGMRRAHDNAVIVGERGVPRVGIERLGAGMHRRPERVGFEPEQQFENFRVGLGSNAAVFRLEGFRRPRLQAPVLVVQENTTILHRGRPEPLQPGGNQQRGFFLWRGIRPPMPWGNTDLLGEFIDAERGASPVAADDDERLRHIGKRFVDDRDDKTFPSAGQGAEIEAFLRGEAINQRMFAAGADENQQPAFGQRRGCRCRTDPAHPLDVRGQIVGRDGNNFVVGGGTHQGGRHAVLDQREIAGRAMDGVAAEKNEEQDQAVTMQGEEFHLWIGG